MEQYDILGRHHHIGWTEFMTEAYKRRKIAAELEIFEEQ